MFEHYKKELVSLITVFGLLSYTVYVLAAEPVKTKPAPVKEVKKPAGKEVKKPVTTKEIVVTPDPKKDPNRKKPTLKKKYADKN